MNKVLHIFILLCFCVGLAQTSTAQKVSEIDSIYCENLNLKTVYYYEQGNMDSALLFAKYTVEYSAKIFGKHHTIYVRSLSILGFLYYQMSIYAAAEPLLKEALAITKKVYGTEHPDNA